MSDRATLRRQLRERRRRIPAAERIGAAEALARQLLALPFAPGSGFVAGYWAVDGEIALHAWQLRLPPGCTYCLPVLHADGRLRFAPWRPGEALAGNRFGIPEPDVAPAELLPAEAMQMVVLPLVGYDRRGHRLGMGGGWYDRTFDMRHRAPAPPWLAGAAFAVQEADSLAREDWDVRLDALCNERKTLLFEDAPT